MTRPLERLPLQHPGGKGLTTQKSTMDPSFALQLDNAMWDQEGRTSARKGWVGLRTGGATIGAHAVEAVHQYIKDDDEYLIVYTANETFYVDADTPDEIADGAGLSTPSASDWQFVNSLGSVLGFQQAHTPVEWDGNVTANNGFDDLVASAGSLPTGNCALAAFGRVWAADLDKTTLKYTDSLSNTAWDNVLDLRTVWPDGLDHIVALAEWQRRLVIFGRRSTLIYKNPHNVAATIANSNYIFELEDVIPRGLVARDAWSRVANDLLYVAHDGLRSLQRGIEYDIIPLSEMSTQVRDDFIGDINDAIVGNAKISMVHSVSDGTLLVRVGSHYWGFDTKRPLEDGNLRASKWFGIGWTSAAELENGSVYLGQTGEVGHWDGYIDDATGFNFRYRSAWFQGEGTRELIPKYMMATFAVTQAITFTARWARNFLERYQTSSHKITAQAKSEWQTADVATTSTHEWGTAEWSGAVQEFSRVKIPMGYSGDVLQIGFSAQIEGGQFAIQRADIYGLQGAVVRS